MIIPGIVCGVLILFLFYFMARSYFAVRRDLARIYKLEMLDYAFRTGGDWKAKMKWAEEFPMDRLVYNFRSFDKILSGPYAEEFIRWHQSKTRYFAK